MIIVRLLLPEGYGFYTVALLPLNILQMIRDWGVPVSVQQRTSKNQNTTENGQAWNTAKAGVIWEGAIRVVLSVILVFGAPIIAALLNRSDMVTLLLIGIPVVASLGTYNVANF